MSQLTGNEQIDFMYDAGGEVIGLKFNGANYYYLKNLQGDILYVVDSSGQIVVKYDYDSWGKLRSTAGSMATTLGVKNPFRYRSYYYDTETGLYYLNSRYYDPDTGRFVNADGMIDDRGVITQNLFQYCGNNPINFCDPSGYIYYGNGQCVQEVEVTIYRADGTQETFMDEVAYTSNGRSGPQYINNSTLTITVAASVSYDLGQGYKARIDAPNSGAKNEQRHVHIEYKDKEVSNQNDDGTIHHPNKNTINPSKRVKKQLKKQTGWDWDANSNKQFCTNLPTDGYPYITDGYLAPAPFHFYQGLPSFSGFRMPVPFRFAPVVIR